MATHSRFPRIGHGFDLHRLEPGHPLVVCGVTLDHDRGCVAHSDGDVVYHAVTDAILGALGMQDIGQFFPDDDPRWKGADSSVFVREAVMRMDGFQGDARGPGDLRDRGETGERRPVGVGYDIGNLDVTVILEKPRLGPHKAAMIDNLAELLHCQASRINLKGKTHEGVDALGENRAIACHAVVLLTPR